MSYAGSQTFSYYFNNRVVTSADTVTVSVYGQISTDNTNWHDPTNYYTGTTYDGGGQVGSYYDGWYFFGYCTNYDYYYNFYYTRNYSDVSRWTGSLTIDVYYGTAALAALADDGVSNFTLTSACSTCDILYLDRRLSANIEESEPEKSALLLFGLDLVSLSVTRRRKYS